MFSAGKVDKKQEFSVCKDSKLRANDKIYTELLVLVYIEVISSKSSFAKIFQRSIFWMLTGKLHWTKRLRKLVW